MHWAGLIIAAYLIGSIPTGLIIGKLIWHKDLRRYGSHNIGATNAWRTLGPKAGLLIFTLDFLKGQLGVLLAAYLIASPAALVAGGLFAVLGHMFPVFLSFKGGKGVATSLGVLFALMPKVAAIVFLVWLLLTLTTRYVSAASIAAAILTPLLAALFNQPTPYILFTLTAALFIVYRHKDNITRLKAGRENKI